MSNTRVKVHPTLGILVGTDGHVMVPANGQRKAHWTFGSPGYNGYLRVGIAGKRYYVHRLVAETFIQYPIPDGYQVDHIDRSRRNVLDNLRIVTISENHRNTSYHDRVDARGGTHLYEDKRQYQRECQARHNQAKRKTHRYVRFSDGLCRWIPHAESEALLAIPLKERIFKG